MRICRTGVCIGASNSFCNGVCSLSPRLRAADDDRRPGGMWEILSLTGGTGRNAEDLWKHNMEQVKTTLMQHKMTRGHAICECSRRITTVQLYSSLQSLFL